MVCRHHSCGFSLAICSHGKPARSVSVVCLSPRHFDPHSKGRREREMLLCQAPGYYILLARPWVNCTVFAALMPKSCMGRLLHIRICAVCHMRVPHLAVQSVRWHHACAGPHPSPAASLKPWNPSPSAHFSRHPRASTPTLVPATSRPCRHLNHWCTGP